MSMALTDTMWMAYQDSYMWYLVVHAPNFSQTNVRKSSDAFLSPWAGVVDLNTIKTTLIALEVAKKSNSVTRFVYNVLVSRSYCASAK